MRIENQSLPTLKGNGSKSTEDTSTLDYKLSKKDSNQLKTTGKQDTFEKSSGTTQTGTYSKPQATSTPTSTTDTTSGTTTLESSTETLAASTTTTQGQGGGAGGTKSGGSQGAERGQGGGAGGTKSGGKGAEQGQGGGAGGVNSGGQGGGTGGVTDPGTTDPGTGTDTGSGADAGAGTTDPGTGTDTGSGADAGAGTTDPLPLPPETDPGTDAGSTTEPDQGTGAGTDAGAQTGDTTQPPPDLTTPGAPTPGAPVLDGQGNEIIDPTEAAEDDENVPLKEEEEEVDDRPYSERFRDPGRGIFEGPRAVGPINQGPASAQYSGLASLLHNSSIMQGIIAKDPFLSSSSSLIASTNPSSTLGNADPNQALLESSQSLFANVRALEFVDAREGKQILSDLDSKIAEDTDSGSEAAQTVDELGRRVYDSVNSGGS